MQALAARSRRSPRPALDDPARFYAYENRIALDEGALLRFAWEDRLPLVRGEVNGIPLRAIPDTAAYGPMLYLDWVAAQACDAYLPGFDRRLAQPEARGGYDWSVPGFVDRAEFGGLGLAAGARIEIVEPVPYAVFGREAVPAEQRGLIGIGQITTHLLFRWRSVWNLPAGTVALAPEAPELELPPGSQPVAARWEPGTRRVWLTVATRAKTLELLLDTGSQLTILPLDALPDDVRLDEDSAFREASAEESSFVVLRRATLDVLRLGDVELRDLEIAVTTGGEDAPEPTLAGFDLRDLGLVFHPQAQAVHLFEPEE
ncbi:MAG: hypothetical protein AAF682_05565 [Planctomycetota bacterium]